MRSRTLKIDPPVWSLIGHLADTMKFFIDFLDDMSKHKSCDSTIKRPSDYLGYWILTNSGTMEP
jgi:hypothetical protein